MQQALDFLLHHIELVVFLTVLAEQVGLPVPGIPLLLAAGAVAGEGQANLAVLTCISVAACLLGDMVWYELGLHRGRQALSLLCRISLEPDACVRRTENFFVAHGVRALVLAKFIPGLSTLAPALAGLFKVSLGRFFLFNGAGSLLWSLSFLLLGYVFSDQIGYVADLAVRFGTTAGIIIAVSLAGYVVFKYFNRQKLLRELRVARITPAELKQLLDDGQQSVIVDLRGNVDHVADPYTIPGALRISAEELEHRHHDIPRDRDIILFCACPNEATAARMALMLKRRGISRVRPLLGGIDVWRELAYPLELVIAKENAVGTSKISS
ncbi:Rhodanese domain protein [Nitrospira japonica]|uniref:Rhodanese domain protein n=1 Tax=Nitrospira japonica TaxID=1325564 RepID=A0A1W1I8N5_9BACT|nr:VTT domain-containing protein [Nitrospira japonica]SLM49408.1 Rhodanese domain protein [Nitrospira japonica]